MHARMQINCRPAADCQHMHSLQHLIICHLGRNESAMLDTNPVNRRYSKLHTPLYPRSRPKFSLTTANLRRGELSILEIARIHLRYSRVHSPRSSSSVFKMTCSDKSTGVIAANACTSGFATMKCATSRLQQDVDTVLGGVMYPICRRETNWDMSSKLHLDALRLDVGEAAAADRLLHSTWQI